MGFYDDKPDLFDTEVKGGAYESEQESSPRDEKRPVLRFKWWEYLIFVIEVALVVYTVLVLLRIVPLF